MRQAWRQLDTCGFFRHAHQKGKLVKKRKPEQERLTIAVGGLRGTVADGRRKQRCLRSVLRGSIAFLFTAQPAGRIG
jgi:hypothetical protein